MAPLFHTRADGSADTLSHDITHTGGGELGAAAAPGAEEVAVHHADEAGREDDEAELAARARDLVPVIATHRPRSES